jgi:M6 family metalloprotease-like protein
VRAQGIPSAHRRTPRHPWRALRRVAALAVGFTAVVAWTLVAGPASAVPSGGPCALERTGAHHSEGVSGWNSAYTRPQGDLDAVMVFLSFPDHAPDVSPGELAQDHFPATADFFDRASYGRFRLHPHFVRRWFRMPRPSSDYGIHRDWAPAPRTRYLRDAVTAAGRVVDFRRYPVVYLVADPAAPGVDSDATKVVNLDHPIRSGGASINRLVTVFERHPPDRNVLAHETNHVFDLPDLYYRPPGGSATDWDSRVGDWDVMGSQFGLAPDLFAWHKWRYGWLDRSQVSCLAHPARATIALGPDEVPGAGIRLIVVRTSAVTALAVEARTARGNDTRACSEGVLLYEVRTDVESGQGPIHVLDGHPGSGDCYGESVNPQLADAPLHSGESYVYRFGGTPDDAVRLHVGPRQGDGGWAVTVDER